MRNDDQSIVREHRCPPSSTTFVIDDDRVPRSSTTAARPKSRNASSHILTSHRAGSSARSKHRGGSITLELSETWPSRTLQRFFPIKQAIHIPNAIQTCLDIYFPVLDAKPACRLAWPKRAPQSPARIVVKVWRYQEHDSCDCSRWNRLSRGRRGE